LGALSSFILFGLVLMCGIVGFLGKKQDKTTLEKMLEAQAHRGRDARGISIVEVEQNQVHLGHNRLSIQDTSSDGHQPFVSTCGEYSIVFNGEIYNFKAIRKDLEGLGHRFISNSDTEVILYAYKAWGITCLEKFIGMFAFCLVDKKQKKMYLVRDRAGVKPLYYYSDKDTFIFSSEIKSFHEHQAFKKHLHKEVLPFYFQMGYIIAPHTIFKNLYKLEAGQYLSYDLVKNTYKKNTYWSVDEAYQKEKFDKSEGKILDDLESLLEDAISLRMVSDVPVGVFLSGGYDSSLVTAILAKNHKDLHTFTIGFDDKRYNEAKHAKEISSYLGTKHEEYYLSPQALLSQVASLPFYYDEPFGDSSALATMCLSEFASSKVKVVLSSDGGDEVFCGYSKYFFLENFSSVFSSKYKKILLQNTLNSISSKRIAQVNTLLPKKYKQSNIEDKYHKFRRALNADSISKMFLEASSPVSAKEVKKLLHEADSKYFDSFKMKKQEHILNNMMRIDYQSFMPDDVLTKVDRATMSATIEGREPLLDHRILEYMARVPIALKYKNKQGKYLSRQLLYKYIPPLVIDKPKAGFQVPLQEWLRGDLKYLVEKYLDKDKIDDEIFDIKEIERIKTSLFLGDVREVNKVWFILMYEMWKERWFG